MKGKRKVVKKMKERRFHESSGNHIVVIGWDKKNLSSITIVDVDDEFFWNLNKSLFN